MDYQDREVCLQKSVPLPPHIRSGSVMLDRHLQVSPEMFGLWLVHSRTFTVVSEPLLWLSCADDGRSGILSRRSFCRGTWSGGGLQWWWTFWRFPPSAHRISASMRTGTLGTLVLDTKLEGPIRIDETLSESPPITWIYGRRRYLCTCRIRRRWNIRQSTCRSTWPFEVRSCRFKAEIFSFQSEALNCTRSLIRRLFQVEQS